MRKSRSLFAVFLVFVMLLATTASVFADTEIREVGAKEYSWNGSKWVLESQYSTKYLKNGRTKSYTNKYSLGNNKWDVSTTTYKYKKGRLASTVRKNNGVKSSRIVYSADGNKTSNFYWNKKKWELTSYSISKSENGTYTYTKYNADKQVMGKTVSTSTPNKYTYKAYGEGGKLEYVSMDRYKNGRRTKSASTMYYSDGSKNRSTTKFKYNKSGRLTKETTTEKGSSGTNKRTTTHKYNKNGVRVKVTEDHKEYVKTTKYNAYGLVTKEVTKWKDTKETYVVSYEYSKFFNNNKEYPQITIRYRDGVPVRKIVKYYKEVKIN